MHKKQQNVYFIKIIIKNYPLLILLILLFLLIILKIHRLELLKWLILQFLPLQARTGPNFALFLLFARMCLKIINFNRFLLLLFSKVLMRFILGLLFLYFILEFE